MRDTTSWLTTRNAVALLAGAVLLQPFISNALNTPTYPSMWEATKACLAWEGNNPNRDCQEIYSPQASRPHVVGTEGSRAVKHFYF